jgi:hypothetical protein
MSRNRTSPLDPASNLLAHLARRATSPRVRAWARALFRQGVAASSSTEAPVTQRLKATRRALKT